MADSAHILTDKKLEEMEKRLSAIYSRADDELSKKYRDLLKSISVQDAEKRKDFLSGKISAKKYKSWRKQNLIFERQARERANEIAAELARINEFAIAYINSELPFVYGLNYNALEDAVKEIKGYSFNLIDLNVVKYLSETDETLLPLKSLDTAKDIRWNVKKMNAEILQGILQGEPMDEIAERLRKVIGMNESAAIRNARTMVTGAENKGRQDSYARAEADGMILDKKWIATHDGRTRHWHRELDGATVPQDEPFVNEFGEIMYPGDPHADPANVYNCRCSIGAVVKGFRKVKK